MQTFLAGVLLTVGVFSAGVGLPAYLLFCNWRPAFYRTLRRYLRPDAGIVPIAVALIAVGVRSGNLHDVLQIVPRPSALVAFAFGLLAIAMWRIDRRARSASPYRLTWDIWTLPVAMALLCLDEAQPSWTGVLVGLWLVSFGTMTLEGRPATERWLNSKLPHYRGIPRWLVASSTLRRSDELGRIVISLGLATLGGSPAHYALAGGYAAWQGCVLVFGEYWLRRDADVTRMVGIFWSWRCAAAVAVITLLLASIGMIIEGDASWLSENVTSTGAAPLLQTVAAIEIALAAIAATSIGIALQTRATAFGPDVAFALLPGRRILAGFALISVSAVLTLWILGAWPAGLGLRPAALASLIVHLGVISSAYVVIESALVTLAFSDSRRIAPAVAALVHQDGWEQQVRMYGWNVHHRGSSGGAGDLPAALRILQRAIRGAIREDDDELLAAIAEDWSNAVAWHPPLDILTQHVIDPRRPRETLELTWQEGEFLDGLDQALAAVVSGLIMTGTVTPAHLHALMPLCHLPFPPYYSTGHHHKPWGDFDHTELPGFRTLSVFATFDVRSGAQEASEILAIWRDRFSLAIRWAERITPDAEQNAAWPHMPLPEIGFKWLTTLISETPVADRDDLRRAVAWSLIQVLQVATSRGVLLHGLRTLDALSPYDGSLWLHDLDAIAGIVARPNADLGWSVRLLERSATAVMNSDNDHVPGPWELDSLFRLWTVTLAALMETTLPVSEYEEAEVRSELVAQTTTVGPALTRTLLSRPISEGDHFRLGHIDALGCLITALERVPANTRAAILVAAAEWPEFNEREAAWFQRELRERLDITWMHRAGNVPGVQ